MFQIRQYLKMFLQNVLLPLIYRWFSRGPVQKGLVLFADAHHEELPFSMQRMYEAVSELEAAGQCHTELFISDFGRMPFGEMLRALLCFMKRYAVAEYVFICDYYLPVASCRKRPETTVVQLWHSCGLMKKIAYDTGEDIPKNYRGNMFGNYTYLTLSAEICVPVHAQALRLSESHIRATGVSRTDYYFDQTWNDTCRKHFFEQYPEARGKRIALWAPTFRGNAAAPRLEGQKQILEAAKELSPDWYIIIKAHPHVDAHGRVSNCTIPTEELLAVTDVLITDYSSVLFDYLLYEKPAVLFAPDLQEYEDGRGFYLNYLSIPFQLADTRQELTEAIRSSSVWNAEHKKEIQEFREQYVGACDGRATQRILGLAGLGEETTQSEN